jgi:hypothetical protein
MILDGRPRLMLKLKLLFCTSWIRQTFPYIYNESLAPLGELLRTKKEPCQSLETFSPFFSNDRFHDFFSNRTRFDDIDKRS